MKANIQNYKNDMKPYLEKISPFINIKYSGFNTQGGFGWEIETVEENSIFLWFGNESNNDLLPEDYDASKTYCLYMEYVSKDQEDIITFKDIEELITFLK